MDLTKVVFNAEVSSDYNLCNILFIIAFEKSSICCYVGAPPIIRLRTAGNC